MNHHPKEVSMKKKAPQQMTKRERIQAAIAGDPVDRVPYSLWSHLPMIDLDPVKNAEHTYDFYKKYDVDILKTMNNGMYSVEDFGAKTDFSDIPKGGVAKITDTPVKEPEDWLKIEPVSVNEGALAREQRYLKLLLDKTKGEVPVIFTVFSPLTTANKLCPSMMDHIRQGHGDKVKQALKAITETTCGLVQRVIELGADGIFFATQLSSYNLTEESFCQFQ
jgi:uroporphyrinogen decarboxylase